MMTLLGAASIAEGIVLACVLIVLARLRHRFDPPASAATGMTQMGDFLREAQVLSATLAHQLEEHAELRTLLVAEADTRRRAATSPGTKRPARGDIQDLVDDEPIAREFSHLASLDAAATTSLSCSLDTDAAAARYKGLDPLGVAVQQSLARQRSLSA